MGPVWITGAGGLIGNYLLRVASRFAPRIPVEGLTRKQLDLADFDLVREQFSRRRPQAVMHCAALSRSPDCEANPALAHRLNIESTALLAELAAEIPFLF